MSSRTAGVALLQPQVARVEAAGLDRDVGLRHEVLVAVERAERGLLTGGVAVEGEDHLAAELLVVEQEPAQHPRVVVAERRAAGRDGGRHAGQVARHHVGVALDDDRLRRLRDLATGQVDAVEHLALLVERGLGGVEVLRLDPVVVEDPPGPEADRVAARLPDRPEQPAPEAVVRRPPDRDEPGRDLLLLGEALLPQVPQQRLALAGGEPDAELSGRGLVEAPLPEELARRRSRRDRRAGRRRTPAPAGWPRSAGPGRVRAAAPGRPRRGPPRDEPVRRTCPPRLSTASPKESPSCFITKVMTSPPSWQPKQW